jgi:hypothetical protein
MDLPWDSIIARIKDNLRSDDEETEEERIQREKNELCSTEQGKQLAQEDEIAKEKEILKKLQHTMARSKTGVDFQMKERQDTMLF